MLESKPGLIGRQLFSRNDIRGYSVLIEGREEKCIVYPALTGEVETGDEVLLNTTAVSLKLGSGGYHYVIARLNSTGQSSVPGGHIMKMRYTPMQVKVLSAEEEDSPYHEVLKNADSLLGTPVLAATLHSMLAPLVLYLCNAGYKVAYVMTDGAALPMAFSQTVSQLKAENRLVGTVTIGHAFGGDLEAVNIYSGLLAAREAFKPDVIVVSMGPGIVGTGTKWGFTGIEQGQVLNAVHTLQGVPIAVPRISFADSRPRHRGISHHSLTVLARVCLTKCIVPVPELCETELNHILQQVTEAGLFDQHDICLLDGTEIIPVMQNSGMNITTMGRGIDAERSFFLAAGAAAKAADLLLQGKDLPRLELV